MEYRREIDGLRALAVIPVILFHAGFEYFGGGFVGVDIFFVISGYLIATIIIKELEKDNFSISDFYERRARRILPALFFVMIVCIPFAWFWLLPSDMKDFSKSLVAVSFFASNILFWNESGYFDTAAELKPLLHTWSLAVEEQYYLIFPILLILLWKAGKRTITTVFGIIFILSLACAQWMAYKNPSAAFFLLPTRAWEMLIGAFAALYIPRSEHINIGKSKKEICGLLGLSMIFYSIFFFNNSTPFPSLYTLVPTLGALLIIYFSTDDTIVGKILGNKFLVGIGLLSYSAYLWHQPLFAFARHRSVSEPTQFFFLILTAITLALAYLSWRFIETPFRNKLIISRKKIFFYSFTGTCIFFTCGMIGYKTDGFYKFYFDNRASAVDKNFLAFIDYDSTETFKVGYRYGTCFYDRDLNSFENYDKNTCLVTSSEKRNYLILGDSHSAHLSEAFRKNFTNINFLQASASGCRPVLPITGSKRCTDLIQYIYNDFLPKTRLDGIILSARWGDSDSKSLTKTINFLERFVPKIYVIGPTVEYKPALPMLISKLKIYDADDSQEVLNFVDFKRKSLSDILEFETSSTSATYIPIFDEICTVSSCKVLTSEGTPLAWDYGHFTIEGADFLIKKLIAQGKLKIE